MLREWKVGDRLENRWEIRKVMKGGMGVVYAVYDHQEHEVLAAKTFQDEVLARNPRIAPMFRKEALAWVDLDAHPNITQALFVREIEGKPVLFLEYVSGGDLSGWIGTPRLLEDVVQVLRFALSCCGGMMHLRAKGIKAHRDIKPQNCLVTEAGVLKVTDFGLVKVTEEMEQESEGDGNPALVSRTGRAAGTATHMAPEQFIDSKRVGVGADVYAFGVMLYQMLVGRLPFKERTWDELAVAHLYRPPAVEEIPHPRLKAVVAQCLEKRSADRWADFGSLRTVLEEIYWEDTGAAPPQRGRARDVAEDAAHWTSKGFSLASLGMRTRAMECYDRALALDPGNAPTMVQRGDLLRTIDRRNEAMGCYNEALAVNPQLDSAWYGKGTAAEAPGEALEYLERALALNPLLARAWSSRGVVLERLGRAEEAARCLHRAVQIDPLMAEGWVSWGNLHRNQGRLEEAQACMKQAVTLHAHMPSVWYERGKVMEDLYRWEDAAESYGKALELDNEFAAAWLALGRALVHWKVRATDALACVDRYLSWNPDSREGWLYRGRALAQLQRFEEALSAFESAAAWLDMATLLQDLGRPSYTVFVKATEDAPASAAAWRGRALGATEPEEALRCWDRALALEPQSEAAWMGKAELLDAAGRQDEALQAFEELVRLYPDCERAWLGEGTVLLKQQRFELALWCFECAETLGSALAGKLVSECRAELTKKDAAENWYVKGEDLAEEGRAEEALACFERALTVTPESADTWYAMGAVLGQLDRAEEAVAAFARAGELNPGFWVTWYRRAVLLQNPLRRYREAIACYEQAERNGSSAMTALIDGCRAEMNRGNA